MTRFVLIANVSFWDDLPLNSILCFDMRCIHTCVCSDSNRNMSELEIIFMASHTDKLVT